VAVIRSGQQWFKRKLFTFFYLFIRKSFFSVKIEILLIQFLKLVAKTFPKNSERYFKGDFLYDVSTLLLAGIKGRQNINSHNFSHILGGSKVISFVFPYYNKEEDLLRAISSLKNQNWKTLQQTDIEIIVVDDGSTNLLDTKIDSDVIYIRRNKFGYGISRSRNLGAKISSGKYITFPDPDFIFGENYVESLFGTIKKYDDLTLISGYIEDYFYESCEDPRVAFGVWENPNRKTSRFLQLAGGHFVISRSLFFEVGGFDEDLIYGEVEDTLFGFLVGQIPETSIVFSSDVRVKHVPHKVGLAHSEPSRSFEIAALKYPEFYQAYVLDGLR
jgi:Glycosyl transferase family 2